MIQFSCHSANFRDKSPGEACGTIARMGFNYVDLSTDPHLPVSDMSKRQKIVDVRELLSIYHLKISDLYLTLPDMMSDTRQAIETFKESLPFVKLLEAQGITLRLSANDDESLTDSLSNTLQTLVNHARQADIAFSIDVRADTLIDTPMQIRTMLNRIDGLQLTLDWSHMVYRSVPESDIIDLLPKTRHVYLRQAKAYSLQTPYEEGDIVPEKVISTLQNADYDGFISMKFLPYSERHHIADVDPIRESIMIRDALRDSKEIV